MNFDVSLAGKYNIFVSARRNDLAVQQEWAEFGDEYPAPPEAVAYDDLGNPVGTKYIAEGHPIMATPP